MDDMAHGGRAAKAQVGQVHLVFQTGHCCLNPGAPPVDIEEGLALRMEPAFAVGDAHRRLLKPGEIAHFFVGVFVCLHRASQHVGTAPTVGKVKAGLKAGLGSPLCTFQRGFCSMGGTHERAHQLVMNLLNERNNLRRPRAGGPPWGCAKGRVKPAISPVAGGSVRGVQPVGTATGSPIDAQNRAGDPRRA